MQTFHLSNMINTYFLHMFYKCVTNNHLLVGYVSYCGCTSSYKCGLIIWDMWADNMGHMGLVYQGFDMVDNNY